MRVEVTQEDIDTANSHCACRCLECPVALGANRAFGQPVTVDGIFLRALNSGRGVELPRVAKKFVMAFDLGRPVAPFAFDLELPEPPPHLA